MRTLSVQSSVPTGGPDTLSYGSPPGAVLLPAGKRLTLRTHSASGSAGLRPYSWKGGRWAGTGYDAAATVGEYPVTANSASGNGTAERTYDVPEEGRWWCVVQEAGAGTIDQATLEIH